MELTVSQSSDVFPVTPSAPVRNNGEADVAVERIDTEKLMFDLGLWLSGLESFLNIRNHSFVEENRSKAAYRDWTKEFRLTHTTLLVCSRLTFALARGLRDADARDRDDDIDLIEDFAGVRDEIEISSDEIYKLSTTLKDASLLNEGMLRAAPLKFGEWTAWCNTLGEKLRSVDIASRLIARAERRGEEYVPEVLRSLLEKRRLPFAVEADLRLVIPRFAKILKWLSVIEEMLNSDAPLKSSLLIFSRIYEQVQELTEYINNRLLRFPNDDDQLFGELDGAVYTASIELRKVYNHELAGLSEIRSVPLIYAKIETAFSLLNDSFQMTLVNFAKMIDPEVDTEQVFPNLRVKLERSVKLRRDLWNLLKAVQEAERLAEKYPIRELRSQMREFTSNSLKFLFFKDRETVERFVEEVLVTNNKKDLVPILHRFGAYLETLFGQVNMRIVLSDHPFDGKQAGSSEQ